MRKPEWKRALRMRSPKRLRAKLKRAWRRKYGLTRRDLGRIGAGHVKLEELLEQLEAQQS